MKTHSLLFGLIGFTCLLPISVKPLGAAERPNIVWLISEDNSYHYQRMFHEHGTETPNIQRLAEHGIQFNHAFSNSPVCSVARTTLMTGCLAPRIGTQFHRRSIRVPLPGDLKMFPAYLREAGYYTTNNRKKDYNAEETPGTWDASSGSASWRGRDEGQPFFHMQSFPVCHESSLHFSRETFENESTETDPDSVFVAPYHPDTELFRYTVARYHDRIRMMDQQIGEVVDRLEVDGLLDDTFIFYFGDHGGVLPGSKGYANEAGLHVPLVVRVPENRQHLADWSPGSQTDGFVQFIDFGATVLSLAGLPIPEEIDGQPFLGQDVTRAEVASRETAFGYADRFDEKYDLVRTLRKGRYEYIRSYQPFNFDGLRNNYRYIMLAYQQWREYYHNNRLNEVQRRFFEPRPAELLFDVEADPYETQDLAQDPEYAEVLEQLRSELREAVVSMPDLSFYPESFLFAEVFQSSEQTPAEYGQEHQAEIEQLVKIADLALQPFDQVADELNRTLDSEDPHRQYWALIVCSSFGEQAASLSDRARQLTTPQNAPLVRTRAAEFLGLIGAADPRPVLLDCLAKAGSGVEASLILNSLVLLRDGQPGYEFEISQQDIAPEARDYNDVQRRLEYLTGNGS